MPTLLVNSQTDLISWNGSDNIQINSDFTIDSSVFPSFPLSFLGSSGSITVRTNPTVSGNYTITITSSSVAFNGLFKFFTTNTMNMSNISFVYNNGYISTNNSVIVCGNTNYNPNVSFNSCSVTTSITTNYTQTCVGGYMGTLYPSVSASTISITNCAYYGFIARSGGGLIGAGWVSGGTGSSCTITITGCYVNISQPNAILTVQFAGIMGQQSQYHSVTISQCIVNVSNSGNLGSTNAFYGFLGQSTNAFSITNCYLVVTVTGKVGRLYWIFFNNTDATVPSSVTNCYFVDNATSGLTFITSSISTSQNASMTFTNCAFNTGTQVDGSPTKVNCIYTYTSTTNTSGLAPFTSWPAGTWNNFDSTSPPTLGVFLSSPFQGYNATSYTDVPTLTVACMFEGTLLLTTDGYVKVEDITYDHELVTWEGHTTKIKNIYINDGTSTPCYRVPAHYFGENIPFEDVYLSGGHAIKDISNTSNNCNNINNCNNSYFHPFHSTHFECKKGVEFGKTRHFCIETEDYYRDTLIASGLPIEGFGGFCPSGHDWECEMDKECKMIRKLIN